MTVRFRVAESEEKVLTYKIRTHLEAREHKTIGGYVFFQRASWY